MIIFCSTPTASFKFGSQRQHEVRVVCDAFGRERYFVDGELVHSAWSYRFSARRSFQAHGHHIQVNIDVDMKGARGQAIVDGQLVEADLFAAFNEQMRNPPPVRSRKVTIALWVLILLIFYFAFEYRDSKRLPPRDDNYVSVGHTQG